jgi:hypothetical protein
MEENGCGTKDVCELGKLHVLSSPFPLSSTKLVLPCEERGIKAAGRITPGLRSLTRLPGAIIMSLLTGFQFGAVARESRMCC